MKTQQRFAPSATSMAALVAALVVCPMRASAQVPAAATKPVVMSSATWRDDLAYLVSTVKTVHPAPFHRITMPEFDRLVAGIARDIPRLSDQQVVLRMAALVASIGDGHSRLGIGGTIVSQARVYPIRLARLADGIRVVAVRPDDERLLGARVVRIGLHDAAAAWDSVATISSGDNIYSKWSGVPRFLTMPQVMRTLGIMRGEYFVLSVVGAQGDTIRDSVPAVASQQDGNWLATGWRGPGNASLTVLGANTAPPASERHRNEVYWFDVKEGTLYVQVNAVQNSRDSVHLGDARGLVSFSGFTQQVLSRLDAGGIERMIVDLRYNDGGDNGLVRAMVAGVAARPSINKRGKLFVITGRDTYSAAMNFTSLFEDRTEALFVGEAPGGSPLHHGDANSFRLPHSGLTLRVSTLRWDTGVAPNDVRQVMEPDIVAPPTVAALHAGHDAAMDAILRYKEGERLSERLIEAFRTGKLEGVEREYAAIRHDNALPAPWNSDAQQLIKFAYGTFGLVQDRAEIFRAIGWVTSQVPNAAEAWFADGRIHAFVGDWKGAKVSYDRAVKIRPSDEVLRRFAEVAARQQ